MPFYEYQCGKCGHHHEVLQKISDAPLKKCPECGKTGLKRLVSAPVFRLKGSGWYETDFKSGDERKRNLAGDGHAGADTKADATAAAKPAAETKTAEPAKPAADKPAAAAKPAAKTSSRKAPAKKSAKSAARKR